MQLMSYTAANYWPKKMRKRERNLKNPASNIQVGANYLRSLGERYHSVPQIAAAYNAGELAVDGWLEFRKHDDQLIWVELIPFSETQDYVKNVWRNYVIYHELYGSEAVRAK